MVRRCRTDLVFHASAPASSSSLPKKQIHNLEWGFLGEDLVIYLNCEVSVDGLISGKANWKRTWTEGVVANQLGNTSSRTITEIKQR